MIKNNIAYSQYSNWRFKVAKASGSFIWDEKEREEYAQSLAKALPEGLNVVFRATGGTEENESEIKFGRRQRGMATSF